MENIRILEGTYKIRGKDQDLAGMVFPLVEGFKIGAAGGYVTVDGKAVAGFPDRNIKIRVSDADSVEDAGKAKVTEREETDEETIDRLRERFDMLEDMTRACKKGDVRAMIVSGPPGVGKSFGVEQVLDKNNLFDKLADRKLKFGIEKGAASAIGLFKLLYNYSDKGCVLVLDDCDTVLYDETSLNLLKAALDSSPKRTLSWNTDSNLLRREGIPEKFEFKGSVIFITNLKFDNVRGKIKDHLDAIMSRCHYLDLTLDTAREKLLRVKQIVKDGMLNSYKFSKDEEQEIVDFMLDNQDKLREISLRMCTKIADLRKSQSDRWKTMAEVTCMRRA